MAGRRAPGPLLFCYHTYYKAPDYLGPLRWPRRSASLTSRRRPPIRAAATPDRGRRRRAVRPGHGQEQALNLCFTERDREGLLGVVGEAHLAMLPPFIDKSLFTSVALGPDAAASRDGRHDALPGDKLDGSNAMLAAALALCTDLPWTISLSPATVPAPKRGEILCSSAFEPTDRIPLGEQIAGGGAGYPGEQRHLCLAGVQRSIRAGLPRGASVQGDRCQSRQWLSPACRGRARRRDRPADAGPDDVAYAGAIRPPACRRRPAPVNGEPGQGVSCWRNVRWKRRPRR